jgi:hypothetical protein
MGLFMVLGGYRMNPRTVAFIAIVNILSATGFLAWSFRTWIQRIR